MSAASGAPEGNTAEFVPVDWNPVVDAAWWEKETTALAARLESEFPQFGPETIEAAIALATTRVAGRARIPNYLPILVARDVKEWLATQAAEQHHPPIPEDRHGEAPFTSQPTIS